MNALAQVAYHRMEEIRLNQLKCANCGHTLGRHSSLGHCGGDIGKKVCRCAGWRDPTEQMALK